MHEIHLSADELIKALLNLEKGRSVCILDSCHVSNLGSHLLMAGFDPVEILEINEPDAESALEILDQKLSNPDLAAILTISYEFGLKLNKITPRKKEFSVPGEPDIFLALFDCLVIHDYNTQKTFLTGNQTKFAAKKTLLLNALDSPNFPDFQDFQDFPDSKISSNFTRATYIAAVNQIQEYIRRGDTYQTNLTQQIRAQLPETLTPEKIFQHLRQNHPAPFASFLRRPHDVVISASPERFFKVIGGQGSGVGGQGSVGNDDSELENVKSETESKNNLNTIQLTDDPRPLTPDPRPLISVSPIKGTRPRGKNVVEDEKLKNELLNSEKDRAENVMIVDLLRNDIGRICKFGSVQVETLCALETHPTLFHLVSTVSGELRENINLSDILRAAFPCGSITGAPKIRTMQIIDELETAPRGLSMGAIGFSVVGGQWSGVSDGFVTKNKELIPPTETKTADNNKENTDHRPPTTDHFSKTTDHLTDLSVAIRTMVLRDQEAVFNVGGGIVIDSIPEQEYEESLTKAQALLKALGAELESLRD